MYWEYKMKTEDLLGDKVEKFLKRAGVARVVEAIEKKTGRDCGCKKRKKKLNSLHQRYLKALEEKDPR